VLLEHRILADPLPVRVETERDHEMAATRMLPLTCYFRVELRVEQPAGVLRRFQRF